MEGRGTVVRGGGIVSTCDLTRLGFCQTQIGSVLKGEVVGWWRARLPGRLQEIKIKNLLSRHWTLAEVKLRGVGLPGGSNWTSVREESLQEVQNRVCLGIGLLVPRCLDGPSLPSFGQETHSLTALE